MSWCPFYVLGSAVVDPRSLDGVVMFHYSTSRGYSPRSHFRPAHDVVLALPHCGPNHI